MKNFLLFTCVHLLPVLCCYAQTDKVSDFVEFEGPGFAVKLPQNPYYKKDTVMAPNDTIYNTQYLCKDQGTLYVITFSQYADTSFIKECLKDTACISRTFAEVLRGIAGANLTVDTVIRVYNEVPHWLCRLRNAETSLFIKITASRRGLYTLGVAGKLQLIPEKRVLEFYNSFVLLP